MGLLALISDSSAVVVGVSVFFFLASLNFRSASRWAMSRLMSLPSLWGKLF